MFIHKFQIKNQHNLQQLRSTSTNKTTPQKTTQSHIKIFTYQSVIFIDKAEGARPIFKVIALEVPVQSTNHKIGFPSLYMRKLNRETKKNYNKHVKIKPCNDHDKKNPKK